jgi:hypothetical protein
MEWNDIVLLVLVGWIFVVGVWVVFSHPTGSRIIRYARRYLSDHPQASEGDLREALRQRFLGGSPPIGPSPSRLAEGVRDRWFPLDRDAIAQRIEAALQIVLGSDGGRDGHAERSATPDRPRELDSPPHEK